MLLSVWFFSASLKEPHARTIRLWMIAFLLGSVSMACAGLRETMPPMLTVSIGTVLVLSGYGIRVVALASLWKVKRRGLLCTTLAPALIWAVLMLVPEFRASFSNRLIVFGTGMMFLGLLGAELCFRHNTQKLHCGVGLGITALADAIAVSSIYYLSAAEGMQTFTQLMQQPFYKLLLLVIVVTTSAWLVLAFGAMIEEQALKLRKEANQDCLTGLMTRRAFETNVGDWLSRHGANAASFCVILFDIDHFKKINDRFGHAVGDEILATFGRICHEHTRHQDSIARWGGEEFVLFLPDTNEANGQALADAIRQGFESSTLATSTRPDFTGVTVSGGITAARAGEISLQAALERADSNLYGAKGAGRNTLKSDQQQPKTSRESIRQPAEHRIAANDIATPPYRPAAMAASRISAIKRIQP